MEFWSAKYFHSTSSSDTKFLKQNSEWVFLGGYVHADWSSFVWTGLVLLFSVLKHLHTTLFLTKLLVIPNGKCSAPELQLLFNPFRFPYLLFKTQNYWTSLVVTIGKENGVERFLSVSALLLNWNVHCKFETYQLELTCVSVWSRLGVVSCLLKCLLYLVFDRRIKPILVLSSYHPIQVHIFANKDIIPDINPQFVSLSTV